MKEYGRKIEIPNFYKSDGRVFDSLLELAGLHGCCIIQTARRVSHLFPHYTAISFVGKRILGSSRRLTIKSFPPYENQCVEET